MLDITVLRRALSYQPSEDEEVADDLAVERMGDAAFDWLTAAISSGSLEPKQQVRAMRLLSRITRHFSAHRKGDLLDLVCEKSKDERADIDTRSAATHIAVMTISSLTDLARPEDALDGRTIAAVTSVARASLARALEIGVRSDVRALASDFLARHPK